MSASTKSAIFAALALPFLITACTEYSKAKRFGTYTYEGKNYDVYRAERATMWFGDKDYDALVLVEAGFSPTASNVIAACNVNLGQSTCNKEFGKVLELRGAGGKKTREESGMGY